MFSLPTSDQANETVSLSPRLTVLNSNSLASLSALLPLANCQKLEHLSLIGNPVRSEKHYREWLIWKVSPGGVDRGTQRTTTEHLFPDLYCTGVQLGKTNLRVLDYKRIKEAERASAKALFEDAETGLPSQLAHSLTSEAATNAANAAANAVLAQSSGGSKAVNGSASRTMTDDEKARVREAIKGASSLEEVKRLERMLAEGKVPEGQAV